MYLTLVSIKKNFWNYYQQFVRNEIFTRFLVKSYRLWCTTTTIVLELLYTASNDLHLVCHKILPIILYLQVSLSSNLLLHVSQGRSKEIHVWNKRQYIPTPPTFNAGVFTGTYSCKLKVVEAIVVKDEPSPLPASVPTTYNTETRHHINNTIKDRPIKYTVEPR